MSTKDNNNIVDNSNIWEKNYIKKTENEFDKINNGDKSNRDNNIPDDSKIRNTKQKNGTMYEQNGWKYISIKGSPRERGYAYGYYSAPDFKQIQIMLKFFMMESYGQTWEYFIKEINNDIKQKSKDDFREYYEEMEGIAEGCTAAGTKTDVDEIIAWNFYLSISYWYSTKGVFSGKEGGGSKDRCSAFIAVGDWTADGKIVASHNSFCDFIDGQYMNVVLDLNPDSYNSKKGCRFIMQTCACWIWSGTDFFVTANGIIGTETTIGGFNKYENNVPIMYRIRNAMQYGKNLDDYVKMLIDGNSGDYANSWLFGDINKNEIMRIELGLKYYNVERTKNGFFIGFNAAYDPKIRNLECVNSGFYDIRRHQGARLVRLNELMDEHKGKINIDIAKKIIADHYDVYLEKDDNPCSRTVCSHYDLDAREYMSQENRPKPYSPHGACDGTVVDSEMAKNMSFSGRFGNSCGIPFSNKEFFDKHTQWESFRPYVFDRPSQPWIVFTITNDYNKGNKGNKGKDKDKGKRHMFTKKSRHFNKGGTNKNDNNKNNKKSIKNIDPFQSISIS